MIYNSTFKSAGKPMKRSPMKRTGFAPKVKPLSGILRTASLKRSPMKSGTTKMRARRLGKAKRTNKHLADMCHGQQCYLLIPGVFIHDPATVVPAHSNQLIHGKGKGIKADDQYTVPGCFYCHAEIDSGKRFSKEQKFAIWDSAYLRWVPVRNELLKAGE